MGTMPSIDLFSCTCPSNGAREWVIEAEYWSPPDVQLWRSCALDAEPTDGEIREVVATSPQKGDTVKIPVPPS